MRILVTGSRGWTDGDAIYDALLEAIWNGESYSTDGSVVVHGGARGADTLAHLAARRLGMQTEVHRPDWSVGARGGIERNIKMIETKPDVCLAFILNRSTGATHCANAAEKAGIQTIRFQRSNV